MGFLKRIAYRLEPALRLMISLAIVAGLMSLLIGWQAAPLRAPDAPHWLRQLPVLFVKHSPEPGVTYRNPLDCDGCDAKRYATLNIEERRQLIEYCIARYGEFDMITCVRQHGSGWAGGPQAAAAVSALDDVHRLERRRVELARCRQIPSCATREGLH